MAAQIKKSKKQPEKPTKQAPDAQNETERDYLERVVPEISHKKVKRSPVPIPVYLQEAESLMIWCTQDREDLQATGLDPEVIDQLGERIELLRRTETFLSDYVKKQKAATRRAKELQTEARSLKSEIIRDLKFALKRAGREADTFFRDLTKNNRLSSLIQDLHALEVFWSKRTDLILPIGLDVKKAKRAVDLAKELSDASTEASVKRSRRPIYTNLRDSAFTHLDQSVGEIRACGRYLFHNNPDRKGCYAIPNRRKG